MDQIINWITKAPDEPTVPQKSNSWYFIYIQGLSADCLSIFTSINIALSMQSEK